MTVTVLPNEVRSKPTGTRGKACVPGVHFHEESFRPPPTEAVPNERADLLGPVDLLLGLTNLLE